MRLKKVIGAVTAAAMLGTVPFAAVQAADEKTVLYYGAGSVTVIADPTDSGRGNVFSIDGYETARGNDMIKGNNPFIELPAEYLYDNADGEYTLKKDFSISFDAYIKSTGYRYAFYTGSDGYWDSKPAANGLYLIPDTGSYADLAGIDGLETITRGATEEHTALARAWHNIEITRSGDTYKAILDGADWITINGSEYEYKSERIPYTRIGYSPYAADAGAYMLVDNIVVKNGGETVYEDTADGAYELDKSSVDVSRRIIVHNDVSDGSETQKLIDASYDNAPRMMEALDRGLIAVNAGDYGFISWRWLGTESASVKYNLYKNGERLNSEPLSVTNYVDYGAKAGDKYSVAPVTDGAEGERCAEAEFNEKSYFEIPIQQPEGGSVTNMNGEPEYFDYTSNDVGVGDLDGDGQYEIVMKWEPTNCKDSSNQGQTGSTIFDAYDTDGTLLWRIDLGINIRSGPHDTQFIVADFNKDGRAEVAMRTADGTVAGDGTVIGDGGKDYRAANGKNLEGPLYLTVFEGLTGAVIDSVPYAPQSQGDYDGKAWTIDNWGDNWGNRSERYLAGLAYIDGDRPSMIFSRGYYDRTAIGAWTMTDENKLEQTWLFDTYKYDDETSRPWRGQGNHSMSIADIDYDGRDEIIFGALTLDDDGTPISSTGLGHGDAQHVTDLIPERPGLEVYSVHEGGADGFDMRDARTGEILWEIQRGSEDVGRGAAADIDPYYAGAESWSSDEKLVTAQGELITEDYSMPANFLVYWDGDLGREVQDSACIYKWNHFTNQVDTIFTADGCRAINSGKSNPSITADLFGDWREEVMYPTLDNKYLRIYTTTEPTAYRIPTLMSDGRYRDQAATQNICYNQPTHVGYNLSYTTAEIPVPNIYTVVNGEKVTNPDIAKKNWSIDELYAGDTVEMEIGKCTALINGRPVRIDNENTEVVPFINNDNTLVPIRFISEAFGAHVEWDSDTRTVTITNPASEIKMAIGAADYTVNGASRTMEVAPEITNDVTFVPLRAAAEALGYNVDWNSGAIKISDKPFELTDSARDSIFARIDEAGIPAEIKAASAAKGEQFVYNQSVVLDATVTAHNGDHDVSKAVDNDFDTYMETTGKQIVMLKLEWPYAVSAVDIAFADGGEHSFKVYTKWDIGEWDSDLTNLDGWAAAVETTSRAGITDPQLKIFPVPKYGQYVKIILDPKDTGDTMQISEIAAVVVK
ncbi:MAG: stalk domain-containing protein [Candidatus Ornithomonoglobus sp.]